MATERLEIQVTDAGTAQKVISELKQLGAAGEGAGRQIFDSMKAASDSTREALRRTELYLNAMKTGSPQAAAAVAGMSKQVVAYESAVLRAEKASVRAFQAINSSAAGSNSAVGRLVASVNGLNGGFGLLGTTIAGALSFRGFMQANDTVIRMENLLKLTTKSAAEMDSVMANLNETATATQTPIKNNVDSFYNLRKSLDETKYSTDQVLGVNKLIQQSLFATGTAGQGADAAMTQFNQALASGKLSGQEFMSVQEQAPIIIEQLARGLGVTRGELKAMADEQEVTTDKIVQAFENQRSAIETMAAAASGTLAGAFTILNNKYIEFIQNSDGAQAGATLISNAILLLADNLNIVIPAVLAFGAAWAALQVVTLVSNLSAVATAVIGIVTAMGPWGPILLTVGTAAAALIGHFGGVNAVLEKMKPFFTGVWEMMKNAIQGVNDAVTGLIDGLRSLLNWLGDVISKAKSALSLVTGVSSSGGGGSGGGTRAARDGMDEVVKGAGAVDSRFMNLMVSPGERVMVLTRQQQQQMAQMGVPQFRDGGSITAGFSGIGVRTELASQQSTLGYSAKGPATSIADQILQAMDVESDNGKAAFIRKITAKDYYSKKPTAIKYVYSPASDYLRSGQDVTMKYDQLNLEALKKGPYSIITEAMKEEEGLMQEAIDRFRKFAQSAREIVETYQPSMKSWSQSFPGLAEGRSIKLRNAASSAGVPYEAIGAIKIGNVQNYEGANESAGARAVYRYLKNQKIADRVMKQSMSFRDGGSFMVPGTGSVDSREMSLNVSPGETVSVKTRQQQQASEGGGSKTIVINMTVNAKDVDSFKRSERQIQADTLSRMARALESTS